MRKYYNHKTCPYHNSTLGRNSSFPTLAQHFTAQDSNFTSELIRRKREAFSLETPVFVETAVFVDKDLFEHMKNNFPANADRELIRFVLAMINAVRTFTFANYVRVNYVLHRYNYYITIQV